MGRGLSHGSKLCCQFRSIVLPHPTPSDYRWRDSRLSRAFVGPARFFHVTVRPSALVPLQDSPKLLNQFLATLLLLSTCILLHKIAVAAKRIC